MTDQSQHEASEGPSGPALATGPALGGDAEINLLSSPIERTLLNRAFVIGGPVCLLLAIVASLWVSWTHVRFYATVQGDTVWQPGSTRALRVQVSSERGYEPGKVAAALTLRHAEGEVSLPALPAVGEGLMQGTVAVPDVPRGPATLRIEIPVEPEPIVEEIALTVADTVPAREPEHIVASAPAQYSNDTEPQPSNVKIDLRAHGRVQTGFVNRFYVRVTDAQGQPWSGPVQVVMIKGELGEHVATPDARKTIVRGSTNALGLLSWDSLLVSEIVRLDIQVFSRTDPSDEVASRAIMLISFSGVVMVTPSVAAADAGEEIELTVAGLSGKRPIYVDIHDAAGAWIETLRPGLGRDPPRPWTVPDTPADGLLQIEAYDQTMAPGGSSAVARLQRAQTRDTAVSLRPLIDAHTQSLALPRVDETFDAERERAWLDHVGALDLTPTQVGSLRRFLIGTLPVTVYGPPVVLTTKARDDEALAAMKARWTVVLRWVLLGGGGLFLAAMTLVMVRSHRHAAERTAQALRALGDDQDRDFVAAQVAKEQRMALLRGLGIIGVMAGALILAVLLLEAMVWQF